jgi:hypothetical protein
MNLSVPAVPALVELLNCDPGPGMQLKRSPPGKNRQEEDDGALLDACMLMAAISNGLPDDIHKLTEGKQIWHISTSVLVICGDSSKRDQKVLWILE